MNQVAPTRSHALTPSTIAPSFVEADGPLGAAIRAVRRDVNIRPVSSELQQAAWKHIHAIEPLCAPGNERQMLAWLVKLAPGVVNAPSSAEDIQARSAAIWDLCSDLPCAVWCDETRRRWLRNPEHGKFWPSAGELFNLLAGFAATLTADKAGCERILAAANETASSDDWKPPTETECAAVSALMQAWRGEKAAAQRSAERDGGTPAKPALGALTYSDELLLELYEGQERHAMMPEMRELGRLRAQGLRKKLGRETPEDLVDARYG